MVSGVCAFCGNSAEGNYSIHRDGFGEGPDVPLCDACGGEPKPEEVVIWAKIGQSEICIECDEEIRHDDERYGSFHGWCLTKDTLQKLKSYTHPRGHDVDETRR